MNEPLNEPTNEQLNTPPNMGRALATLMFVYEAVSNPQKEATRPELLRIMKPVAKDLDALWSECRGNNEKLNLLFSIYEGRGANA